MIYKVITFQSKEIINILFKEDKIFLEYDNKYRTKDIDIFIKNNIKYSPFYSFIFIYDFINSKNVISNIPFFINFFSFKNRYMIELEIDEEQILSIKDTESDKYLYFSNFKDKIQYLINNNIHIILEATLKYMQLKNVVSIRKILYMEDDDCYDIIETYKSNKQSIYYGDITIDNNGNIIDGYAYDKPKENIYILGEIFMKKKLLNKLTHPVLNLLNIIGIEEPISPHYICVESTIRKIY